MARIELWGAELNDSNTTFDARQISPGTTFDTAAPRSGARAMRCDSSAGNNISDMQLGSHAAAVNRIIYARTYMRFESLPGSTTKVLAVGTTDFSARLTSGGKLQLFNDTLDTQIGSDSADTISTGTYYRIEMSVTYDGATATTFTNVELRLNGTTVASQSGLSLTAATSWRTGWITAPGANLVCYVDDAALNDSTGGSNNSWCGDGKVILMLPISDNARGNWTAGAGGTTNLFDGVNNTPPAGVADGSATNTSQIKIKSTSLPSSCDLNLDTYTNAGVSGTVNAVKLGCIDGEDPATGTKAGTAEIVSNPASGTVSFNFGNDAGAQGTYLGLWKLHQKLVDAPSVTLGTAPVIRVTCTSGSTGTRAASCCLLVVYVDYTPPSGLPEGFLPGLNLQQAVNRAGTFCLGELWVPKRRLLVPV